MRETLVFYGWVAVLSYLFVHMGVFLLRMNGVEVGGVHYGK